MPVADGLVPADGSVFRAAGRAKHDHRRVRQARSDAPGIGSANKYTSARRLRLSVNALNPVAGVGLRRMSSDDEPVMDLRQKHLDSQDKSTHYDRAQLRVTTVHAAGLIRRAEQGRCRAFSNTNAALVISGACSAAGRL